MKCYTVETKNDERGYQSEATRRSLLLVFAENEEGAKEILKREKEASMNTTLEIYSPKEIKDVVTTANAKKGVATTLYSYVRYY